MAHLHFKRTVYKSGGRKAAERVTYMTRDGAREPQSVAERHMRYIAREDREDLVYTRSRNLPAWAAGSPQTYFRAAEQYEWARGNAFEEWKITLPQELSPGQNMHLMRDLVEVIAGDRLPITYAFHAPATMDGAARQPHLHLLLSGRQQDGIARPPAQHFKKYNRVHPERGGAPKDAGLYHLRAVKQWRVTMADVVNVHLERAGREERVHPDRLDDRGLTRQPEPKLLPSESDAYRQSGTVSPRMQEVLAIRAQRQQTRAEEQADARTYWEERKVTLGLTAAMEVSAQLAVIGAARGQARDQTPARQVILGEVGMEQDDRTLGDLTGAVDAQDAQAAWDEVQTAAEERCFGALVGQALAQARHEAGDVWEEAQWEQEMLDVGWVAVRAARDEGDAALAAGLKEQEAREQARAWQSLEQSIAALVAQLDRLGEESGGRGGVRIRLWERDQG